MTQDPEENDQHGPNTAEASIVAAIVLVLLIAWVCCADFGKRIRRVFR